MTTKYKDRYESITLRFTPEEYEALDLLYKMVCEETGTKAKISKHRFVKALVRFGMLSDGVEVIDEL